MSTIKSKVTAVVVVIFVNPLGHGFVDGFIRGWVNDKVDSYGEKLSRGAYQYHGPDQGNCPEHGGGPYHGRGRPSVGPMYLAL